MLGNLLVLQPHSIILRSALAHSPYSLRQKQPLFLGSKAPQLSL